MCIAPNSAAWGACFDAGISSSKPWDESKLKLAPAGGRGETRCSLEDQCHLYRKFTIDLLARTVTVAWRPLLLKTARLARTTGAAKPFAEAWALHASCIQATNR